MTKHAALLTVLACLIASAASAGPPAKAAAHYERGMQLKRANKMADSAAELRAAIAAYPKYMQAHYALGWVYRALGKPDAAIEAFREVIRLEPHSPEAVESARAIQRIRLGTAPAASAPSDIAFATARQGNTDIYVMDPNGENLRRITDDPAVDDSPAWSPDGRRLAFVSERDGNREVYLCDISGGNLQRITDNPAVDDHPVWSPDGLRIAFESNRGGNMDVYVVAADGTDLQQITYSPADDWMGDWDPRGGRIAILSLRDQVSKVYIINADGSFPRRLVENTVPEGRPVWSGDGRFVYFTWNFDRNYQVCRADVDGRGLANVTRSPFDERICDVSADGRRIVVTSNRDNDEELYVIDMVTGAARRITFNPGADRHAAFQPPAGMGK